MKTLVLLRHAKSSWANPELPDIRRPLNDRGRRDVPKMGDHLADRELFPDMILSSPAERALHTARMIAPYLKLPAERVETADELYMADTDVMLSIAQLCDDNVECLLMVGHNPGITQFANELTDVPMDHMPTCAAFVAKFSIKHWHELMLGTGDFVAFEYPKKY